MTSSQSLDTEPTVDPDLHDDHECDGTGECLSSHLGPNDSLVTANLPAGVRLPSHPNFEHPDTKNYEDLTPPNIISYRLRYCFATSSTPSEGLRKARVVLKEHQDWEINNVLNVAESLAEHLERAGPYLRDELEDAFSSTMASLNALIDERKNWYSHKLPSSLKTAAKNAESDIDANEDIRSAMIVSEKTFDEHVETVGSDVLILEHANQPMRDDLIISESYFETDQVPTKYGFDLPQRFLVCESGSRDHYHLFLPWCGVLDCTCGYSRKNPLCKHMIAALTYHVPNPDDHGTRSNNLHTRGPDVHPRFERFVKTANEDEFFKQFTARLESTNEFFAEALED